MIPLYRKGLVRLESFDMTEEWRPVTGYEGLYEVSCLGRVRDLNSGRIRALVAHTDGYPTVRLSRAGADKRFYVHRLVCRAFNGEPNALHRQVAHLDGNPTNCSAGNLKWASPGENNYHKRLHGTHQAGERHPRSRLSDREVSAIRISPASSVALGLKFGVDPRTIRKIRRGERWRAQ